MKPAAGAVVDFFGDSGGEGDDIVVENLFQITLAGGETGRVKLPRFAPSLDFCKVFFRNNAFFNQRFAGEQFDVKPKAEFVFIRPDGPHFGARVARNHPSIKNEK